MCRIKFRRAAIWMGFGRKICWIQAGATRQRFAWVSESETPSWANGEKCKHNAGNQVYHFFLCFLITFIDWYNYENNRCEPLHFVETAYYLNKLQYLLDMKRILVSERYPFWYPFLGFAHSGPFKHNATTRIESDFLNMQNDTLWYIPTAFST